MRYNAKRGVFARIPAVVLAICVLGQPALAAETVVHAYAPLSASGTMTKTSPSRVSFAGSAGGLVVFENDQGLVSAGNVACTLVLDMESADGTTVGSGKCSVIGNKGQHLYGSFACTGMIGYGCKGRFTIEGGTDEFQGASGAAEFSFRSQVAEAAFSSTPASVSSGSDGIAIWRNWKIVTVTPTSNKN